MTPKEKKSLEAAAYYVANRERILAKAKAAYKAGPKKIYDTAYRKANRIKINERYMAWRRRNLEDQKAKDRARRAANLEKYVATDRAWREKNAEYLKAYEKKRRKENPTRGASWSKAWKAAHPEEVRNHVRNRRAKLRDGGILSKGIEKRLMALQGGRCAVCKCDLSCGFDLDHIYPVALGGKNEDYNVQLLCRPCNRSKGAKLPEVFMQERGLLL